MVIHGSLYVKYFILFIMFYNEVVQMFYSLQINKQSIVASE